ncbi:MAG: phosphatidate cytidylyltransferase [Planctomycetes bacterium]|nr:phosphatidate cytidylyltransferase [Planctomycetota bacterium]
MLRWRLLVAAAIIVPLVGLLLADFHFNFGVPGIWLCPLALLLTVMASAEVLDLLRSKDLRPMAWSIYAGALLVVVAGFVPQLWLFTGSEYPADWPLGRLEWPLLGMATGVVLAFVGEMARYEKPGGVIVNVALSVFTIAYAGLLLVFLIALRTYHSNEWGMVALISTVFVTKMTDTGAYTFGRLFGRHKMSPILSPKKTIEGGIGGIVTACLCSFAFFYWLAPVIVGPDAVRTQWWGCIVYGVVVGIAGMIGDLSESLLKRDMERKDSSSWMPGLGGVLDVLDSLLFAAPAAYLCFAAGIVGP